MSRSIRTLAAAAGLTASATALYAQTTPPAGGTGTGTGTAGTPGAGTSGTGAAGTITRPGTAVRDSVRTMGGATTRRGGMGRSRSGATDTALIAQLDSVNAAAKAGLTNLAPSAAASLVGRIRDRLVASRTPALRSIATDLAALQREFGMSTVNGPRVGAILRRVGPKVTRVAATQSGAVAARLREIGSELTSSGRQLGAGAAAGTASQ